MNDRPDDLESAIHRALRDLPNRPAPVSLERRVLAELRRRAALPWWRQSYAHWPVAARALFLAGSAGLAAVAVAVLFQVLHGPGAGEVAAVVAPRLAWVDLLRSSTSAVIQAATDIYRAIPAVWIYGGLCVIAAFYATLIGVGAAAYRAFRSAP